MCPVVIRWASLILKVKKMEISEAEFQRDLAERRAMQSFIRNYRGDASEIQREWLKFRSGINVYNYMDTATVKAAFDKVCPKQSFDDLLASTERLLKMHDLLHGVPSPEDRLTVADKFKYRAEGDTYRPYHPRGLLASFPEPSPEEMAERAKAELEEKVEALRQKRNTGLRGILGARRSEGDKHRNVLF